MLRWRCFTGKDEVPALGRQHRGKLHVDAGDKWCGAAQGILRGRPR